MLLLVNAHFKPITLVYLHAMAEVAAAEGRRELIARKNTACLINNVIFRFFFIIGIHYSVRVCVCELE